MTNRAVQVKRWMRFMLVGAALGLQLACNSAAPQPTNQTPSQGLTQQSAPTGSSDWMLNAGYGVMVVWTSQSLPQSGGATSNFCSAVNAFDVNAFAQQLQESGAGYFIFSISHAQQFFPFPSAKLDSILPGRTCARDLPSDLYNAIAPKGIKMMFYYPSVGTDEDVSWRETSKFNSDPAYFAQLQYDLVEEIGNRYGNKLAGWWVDNCYDSPPTYSDFGAGRGARYNFTTYANKLREGNPNRLVTFNFSYLGWNSTLGLGNVDYAAGEENVIGRLPSSRFSGEGNSQWQILTWMDEFWVHDRPGTPTPRYSDAEVTNYIRNIMDKEGVFTYNAAPYQDTLISSATMNQLRAVNSAVHNRKVDDASIDLVYSGGWGTVAGANYANSTGHYSQGAASQVQYNFSGTGIKWYGVVGGDQGRADVFIDDQFDSTVDLYATDWAANTVVYAKRGLTNGPHTLKIVARVDKNAASSNHYVQVDALEALGTGTSGETKLDDRASQISYNGNWGQVSRSGYFNDTGTYSDTAGSQAQYTFTGSSIYWYGVTGTDHGKADVYIDNVLDSTVDMYSSTRFIGLVYSKVGLANGSHTLKIVVRSDRNANTTASYVEIDALEFGTSGATKLDDRDPQISYSSGWSTLSRADNYLGTTTYTNLADSQAQYNFTGTGINWYGVAGTDHGKADVFIDNVFDSTVDLYAAARSVGIVYSRTGLPNGNHTIKIVTRSDRNPSATDNYVEVDALEYQ